MQKNDKLVGRTLKDLMEEHQSDKILDNEMIFDLNLEDIKANPNQPRKYFDEESIKELAISIKEHGVFQPIIVKKDQDGYLIVSGERRVRASKEANLKTIPAVIRTYNTNKVSEISLVENLQREDLSSIEEAMAYSILIDKGSLSHNELAEKVGKSRSHITNMLGLLKLPQEVQEMVMRKELSMGHARVLSKMDDPEEIISLAKRVIKDKLSVRDLEQRKFDNLKVNKNKVNYNKEYKEERNILNKYYNSKVSVSENKVVFKIDSKEELQNLVEMLMKNAL